MAGTGQDGVLYKLAGGHCSWVRFCFEGVYFLMADSFFLTIFFFLLHFLLLISCFFFFYACFLCAF